MQTLILLIAIMEKRTIRIVNTLWHYVNYNLQKNILNFYLKANYVFYINKKFKNIILVQFSYQFNISSEILYG